METLIGLLKTAAPAVATILGGPIAGTAVKFLGQALLGDESADVETVTDAVKTATPDQLSALDGKWKIYKAQTERLIAEQGEVTDTMVAKLDTPTANKIAFLRMTTRPWAVRRMIHLMMLPIYITGIDVALVIINIFIRFFHSGEGEPSQFELVAATFLGGDSIYYQMYEAGVIPAAGIVMAYMGLRQIEKSGSPIDGIMKMWKQR